MDSNIVNPDLVDVADQVAGNPDPNLGSAQWRPRELGELSDAADAGYPPAANDPPADVFPTPTDVEVGADVPLLPVLWDVEPDAVEIYVDEQQLGQGSMVPVDPGNLAVGYTFQSPAEIIVTGPTSTVQTNRAENTAASVTVTAVLNADALPAAAGQATRRFYLRVATPPLLTSFQVSLLGRQVVFADDTLTAANRGACRIITGYGGNYVVIDRADETVDNGDVPELDVPQVGDVLTVETYREGSEDVSTTGDPAADVFVLPVLPPFVGEVAPPNFHVDVTITDGPEPIIGSGVRVPSATEAYPAEQYVGGPGLPENVFA